MFGSFAEVLERHRDVVEYSNTWGDALYAVITDAVSAAACALELQEAVAESNPEAVGLPADLSLRLGGHVGPIFPVPDLVLNRRSFVGSHVNRTARIEPVTPPGAVYVTSPFAAALELARGHRLTCDYVGHRPAAKDYGSFRMYRLRQATRVESARGAGVPTRRDGPSRSTGRMPAMRPCGQAHRPAGRRRGVDAPRRRAGLGVQAGSYGSPGK